MPPLPDSAAGAASFQIGDWLVEPDLNRLSRGDTTVQLEIRMMQVLVHLAERAGAVVTREALFDAVWATEFVSDNALTHAIAEIRRALGDSARRPAYVETIHRKGYRLIAPVRRRRPSDRGGGRVRFWLTSAAATVPLHPGETVIGRGVGCGVAIESPKVSRRHARIVVDGDRVVVEDLGSTNGTSVNGSPLRSPRVLAHGDEIEIGHAIEVFQFACSDPGAETVASRSRPPSPDPA